MHPISIRTLRATLDEDGSARAQDVDLNGAIMAGWTGRDPVALEKHVAELAALGGIRPSRRFEYEMENPVLGRTLSHGYDLVEFGA